MIAAHELSLMKPSAFLINAARGLLVDEAALLATLQKETIAGAALDVYEFEPQITKGLAELNNIILCPHLGNATIEARTAMAQIAANNILAVFMGSENLSPYS
jgi:glyoxylate reductase